MADVTEAQISAFLKTPKKYRLVLLHGSDEGLIRERAQMLVRWTAGSLDDPFRVTDLIREHWDALSGEMASLSMMGGRRVIRMRDVTDAATDMVRTALAGKGDALAVLEAPGLGKGKLVTLISGTNDACAVACYPEEGDALRSTVRSLLAQSGATADGETIEWIAASLGGDRAILRAEVEKLALLAGTGGRMDLAMAQECAGDGAQGSADGGALAATAGNIAEADSLTERALADGLGGVGLLRITLSHLQKLHTARLAADAGGLSPSEAVATIRPPVFRRAQRAMIDSLRLWPAEALLRAIEEARQAELACKRTGAPQELLARRFLSALARQAAARAARR